MTHVENLNFPIAIKAYLRLWLKLPIEKLVYQHDFSIDFSFLRGFYPCLDDTQIETLSEILVFTGLWCYAKYNRSRG